MATAARSYYGRSAAPVREPRRQIRPDVRVIPGSRSANPALAGLSVGAVHAFKLVLVVAFILAAICGVRVMLAAATVENLQNSKTLTSTLEAQQATSHELEIQHSMLASPARIEAKAAALGMVEPAKVTYIKVKLPKTAEQSAASAAAGTGTADGSAIAQ